MSNAESEEHADRIVDLIRQLETAEAAIAENCKTIAALTKERDCWIYNAKQLQADFNALEAKTKDDLKYRVRAMECKAMADAERGQLEIAPDTLKEYTDNKRAIATLEAKTKGEHPPNATTERHERNICD